MRHRSRVAALLLALATCETPSTTPPPTAEVAIEVSPPPRIAPASPPLADPLAAPRRPAVVRSPPDALFFTAEVRSPDTGSSLARPAL